MTLSNKTVVILGGSSGIGLATARAAKDEGAHVIITGVRSNASMPRAPSWAATCARFRSTSRTKLECDRSSAI